MGRINEQNLQALHSVLPQTGIDIPYDEFQSRMASEANRRAFFDHVSPLMDSAGTNNLGTYEEFESRIALQDPTPLNRPPVEIPYENEVNWQDSVTLEMPIDEEKKQSLFTFRRISKAWSGSST